jgi:ankyrin repeat protein
MSYTQLLEVAISKNSIQDALNIINKNVIHDYSEHLLHATSKNLYDVVNRLLEIQIKVINATNFSGETSLFLAVKQNNYNLSKLLLEKNANVNLRRTGNRSCLRWAIEINTNIEIIKLLIFYKSNLEETDENNNTLLLIASKIYNNTPVVKLLIDAGANINAKNNVGKNLLILTCLKNNTYSSDVLQLLIFNKVNVNDECIVFETATSKKTYAIIEASTWGHLDKVNILITAGANLEVTTYNNLTPLLIAIRSWNTDLVKILISSGANVNAITDETISAIMLSCGRYDMSIFKLLLYSNKIDLNYTNKNNENIYEYLLFKDFLNNIIFILELNKFTKNKYNQNTLIEAIFENNLKKIKLNLHLINEVDSLGNSPLFYAILTKNVTIQQILLEVTIVNLFSVNNKNVSIFDLDNNINKLSDLTKLTQKKLTHNYNIASCELLSKYLHQDVIDNIIFKYITNKDKDIDAIFKIKN